ncbi:MAG: ATP-binding protein, partial [Proteobacteria bacterium]|nr:ATP-binding protein [Pseudomonadota bacterium]
IFGCRRDIVRALQNIFQNAVEAMPSSGRIKASSELLPENLCQLTLFNSDSFVPKRIRERIFDIAYTCGKPKGKGLGLAFARQVIEQHHGKIICESKEDGTSFVVLLPAIGANEPVRPLRLAIVDDDLFVHMTWSIDQPTLNICSFHDPTTFVTSMSEDPKLLLAFDVIIMDYRFRNEPPTGIDHARVLKTLPNCPPILLATQASLPETVWHNAVDAVIAKRPLSQNAVQQLLESFVPQKGDL